MHCRQLYRNATLLGLLLAMLCLPGLLSAQSKLPLSGNWEFREDQGKSWMPASVPGTVHADLLNNKVVPDPYWGANAAQLQWIEQLDWEYRKFFNLSDAELKQANADLVLNGLDTYAEVYLNGHLLRRCDNMHRKWILPCKPHLKSGQNELRIKFLSPIQQALPAYKAMQFELPAGNDEAKEKVSPYVRKAAFHFGWDFAPRLVTCGIWRDVELHFWGGAKLHSAYFAPISMGMEKAVVQVEAELDVAQAGSYQVNVFLDGGRKMEASRDLAVGRHRIPMKFELSNPKYWWPRGMGKQDRYQLELELEQAGKPLDKLSKKVGLRKIELKQEKDAQGTGFQFVVNAFDTEKGGPIFVKGANVVPMSAIFPNQALMQRQLLEDAAEVGMNMLRVWGGGIYPDEQFYEVCDSLGLMVWQDLMFACTMYPLEGDFLENALEELKDNVDRLKLHPSLALWCGNNEIEVAWKNWGWQQQFGYSQEFSDRLWKQYQHFFEEAVPNVLLSHDPVRPYIPTSPLSNWGNKENFKHHNMHYWGVWHGSDSFEQYAEYVPRFMSEYGFQSWPSAALLQDYANEAIWSLDSDAMKQRQKSYKGNAPILQEMEARYGKPKDFSSFLLMSQLLQRDAMRIAIGAHRAAEPFCMGTLYWQLNDCWPGPSWSTIQVDGSWKAAHFALKRLYGPMLIVPRLEGDSLKVKVVSEELSGSANLQLRIKNLEGVVVADYQRAIQLRKGAGEYLAMPLNALTNSLDPSTQFLELALSSRGEIRAREVMYFGQPKDLKLQDPDFSYQVHQFGPDFRVDFTSKNLVKDLEIQVSGMPHECSDNYFDLLPGQMKSVWIKVEGLAGESALMQRLRLRDLSRLR